MHYVIFIFSLLFLSSCSSNKEYEKPVWLMGKWIKANSEQSNATYEFWNSNFNGLGFTLQERDTTFVERMSILKNNGAMYLQILGLGNTPTYFRFTSQSKNSFTVENNETQFPKKIKYSIENDTLKTIISNHEFSLDFKFVKVKN